MQLQWLSDETLHTDLLSSCKNHRKGLAGILRYLGEVDDRRLYATMGYPSLFAYCIKELKMSENEAGPRVAVARLAKEYAWVLEALAGGDVHLTGLFKLSAHMTPSNCLDLLWGARGKTVRQIEDLLASFFPKPDVPEILRALPLRAADFPPPASTEPPRKSSAAERTIPMFNDEVLDVSSDNIAPITPAAPIAKPIAPIAKSAPITGIAPATHPITNTAPLTSAFVEDAANGPALPISATVAGSVSAPSRVDVVASQAEPVQQTSSARDRRGRSEKLSALSTTRHTLQISISTNLRKKLERAKDLMSHRRHGGRFENIVDAAVDLLLEKLERDRLGKTRRPSQRSPSMSRSESTESTSPSASSSSSSSLSSSSSSPTEPSRQASTSSSTSSSTSVAVIRTQGQHRAEGRKRAAKPASRALPRAVRREVFERDGEQCSFVSKAGVRCEARSSLEIDHVHPKALGGDDTIANTRVLCATHNRLAAEEVFGRDRVRRKIRECKDRRQRRQKHHG